MMKLYRVRIGSGLEWLLVLAETAEQAVDMVCEDIGLDKSEEHWRAVEYPLDEAYILPPSWRSEPEETSQP